MRLEISEAELIAKTDLKGINGMSTWIKAKLTKAGFDLTRFVTQWVDKEKHIYVWEQRE